MRARDRTGLALAPLFLRLALAITFLWAGLGKFAATIEVQGQDAATLANYGVIPNPHAAPSLPAPRPDTPDGAPTPTEAPAPAGLDGQARTPGAPIARLAARQQDTPARATAADFPDPVSVPRWAGLVLLLDTAIHPGLSDQDSSPRMPLWFDADPETDDDPWPRYAALAVAVTELAAGVLIALGLLTRVSALSLAVVMLGALWLTTIGPALQAHDAVLGFLPNHPAFDPAAWNTPLLQLILLCCAMALFFTGAGTLSLDRLLLGGPPRPAPPKPAPQPAVAKK